MSKVADAWHELNSAMLRVDPACLNDSRFTSDDIPATDLAPICNVCPLFGLCRTYADAARPPSSVYAGKRYGTKEEL